MTTQARAVSSDTEELASTIVALKSRLNELETASGSNGSPIGTIVDYIGTAAPTGWTVLDGSTITNGALLYPNLWAILPASFKSGNDIVKPDTRGRVTVHQSSAGTLAGAVGSTGGSERVTLSSSEMPVHNHTITHTHTITHDHTMAHTHTNRTYSITTTSTNVGNGGTSVINSVTLNSNATGENTGGVSTPNTGGSSAANTGASSAANTGDTGGTGGVTQSHENLQPYMVTVKIMKLR